MKKNYLQIFMYIKNIVKIITVSNANHTLSRLKWLTDMAILYVILKERPSFLAFQTFMWKCAPSIGVILVVEFQVGDKKHL